MQQRPSPIEAVLICDSAKRGGRRVAFASATFDLCFPPASPLSSVHHVHACCRQGRNSEFRNSCKSRLVSVVATQRGLRANVMPVTRQRLWPRATSQN